MPLYDYKNLETGKRDVRFNTYEDRDNVPAPWIRVPSRICIPGTANDRPLTDEEGLKKQFYEMEQEEGSSFKGICEFSKKDLDYIHFKKKRPPTYEEHELAMEEANDPDRGKKIYIT